ncbi:hypothetical protein LTR78_001967 [Recurvomyces mirabilis]|uniref:t-SNARE coiled-coil homology domain-containing protein n=1 Tax=Recurvomyces mirabilis TaxID=574656 RepID=A0AAE0WU48_9PEZI|nr:hypothetical protein LTR78_001967 [Recurvomyces mirabilis]KAK5160425.1 hypothetical protein LTS14_001437 [Recurvomyces mirabilis]
MASLHQLFLLADHLKLSLLERQRAVALKLEPTKQDTYIQTSLNSLKGGLNQLEAQDHDSTTDDSKDLARLRQQYNDLLAQFEGHTSRNAAGQLKEPNDESLREDFQAARQRPSPNQKRRGSKNVRFHDNTSEDDAEDIANRSALFAAGEQDRYRDDPEAPPDQSQLDNQQIHAYHSQVITEQDEQLDVLGQSVRRQRMLGIEMGNELEGQNEMLDDVERGVDRHTSTLERARRRLGNVARKSKDNWSWVTIGILICILVLLIVVLK